jgi:uncharacterized protein
MTVIDAVDVDVHCAPESMKALLPYFDGYWRNYVTDGEIRLSPTVNGAYPLHAATSGNGQTGPPSTVDALREQLLDTRENTLSILNCVTSFGANRNPYYEAALTRAVNDWMRYEWLDHDDRLRGSLVVPASHVDAAVEEIERLGDDPRFVQVLLPVRGHDARYGNLRFRKIFEAAARHDLVVGLHAWGKIASAPTSTGFTNNYLEDYLTNSQIVVQAQVVSLITEGVFDELPSLRVSLLECGFSWLPALLWRFDKDWKAVWREVPWLTRNPSEYVYEHFRATTEPAHLPAEPDDILRVLKMMRGSEFLMFASDFPHDHGDGAQRLLRSLDAEARESVMWRNASAFYRLDRVPA